MFVLAVELLTIHSRFLCMGAMKMTTTMLESALTCPHCGYVSVEVMPTDACIYFYECTRCKALLSRSLATVVSSVRMARSSARPFKKDVLVARVPLLQPNVKEPIPCTGGTEMLRAYMHSRFMS
jgi:DNA-directed RNA polymerase subunit RPC12/RpoP